MTVAKGVASVGIGVIISRLRINCVFFIVAWYLSVVVRPGHCVFVGNGVAVATLEG